MMDSKTAITLRAILFSIVCPVILIFASALDRTGFRLAGPLLVGAAASLVTFIVTVLFVRWDRLRLADVGCGFSGRTGWRLALGFLIGSAIVAFEDLIICSGGHAHWELAGSGLPFGSLLMVLGGFFVLALREELSFRSYSLFRMETAWGLWPALVIIGVFFTLEHAAGGWSWSRALLGPPAMALLLGMAALATRGLAVPVGIHASFNFGQWIMGQKETQGPLKLVVDAGFSGRAEVLGYAGYWVGIMGATVGFWIWRRRTIGKGRLHDKRACAAEN